MPLAGTKFGTEMAGRSEDASAHRGHTAAQTADHAVGAEIIARSRAAALVGLPSSASACQGLRKVVEAEALIGDRSGASRRANGPVAEVPAGRGVAATDGRLVGLRRAQDPTLATAAGDTASVAQAIISAEGPAHRLEAGPGAGHGHRRLRVPTSLLTLLGIRLYTRIHHLSTGLRSTRRRRLMSRQCRSQSRRCHLSRASPEEAFQSLRLHLRIITVSGRRRRHPHPHHRQPNHRTSLPARMWCRLRGLVDGACRLLLPLRRRRSQHQITRTGFATRDGEPMDIQVQGMVGVEDGS
jgi:hypothetical protein